MLALLIYLKAILLIFPSVPVTKIQKTLQVDFCFIQENILITKFFICYNIQSILLQLNIKSKFYNSHHTIIYNVWIFHRTPLPTPFVPGSSLLRPWFVSIEDEERTKKRRSVCKGNTILTVIICNFPKDCVHLPCFSQPDSGLAGAAFIRKTF